MVEREEKNIKNRKIKIKQNKKAKSIKQINKLIKKRKNNSLEKREGKKKIVLCVGHSRMKCCGL